MYHIIEYQTRDHMFTHVVMIRQYLHMKWFCCMLISFHIACSCLWAILTFFTVMVEGVIVMRKAKIVEPCRLPWFVLAWGRAQGFFYCNADNIWHDHYSHCKISSVCKEDSKATTLARSVSHSNTGHNVMGVLCFLLNGTKPVAL